jgi:peptidoglycan/LPS O-acetylase OafA/YrhL
VTTYRRDIDGLRAIAVLPVILFHSHLGVFTGGYVGVDVFFVISGYLITSLLRGELETSRFSIVRFYERRVRRLFPALFAMVVCTIAAAWCLLSPDALREFGQSVAATTVFASNIFFWLESGYFARASENLPLLHTWSLAVEEQYYVVFPPLLWLLARAGRRAIVVGLSLLTALSFAAAAWVVSRHPEQAFYLPHLRAWELFVGALAAYDLLPALRVRAVREVVAGAGLVAIMVAMCTYSADTPFPGLAAVLPCVGAVAIIHAGGAGPSWVSALLSTRIAVGIGLISYSLYLWHWPVFVLQRHYTILPPTTFEILSAIAAIFFAAWLSWRYVERPFRGHRLLRTRARLFTSAGALLAVLLALGLLAHVEQGFPARFSTEILATGAVTREYYPLRDRCFQFEAQDYQAGKACRIGASDAPPDFILWGDSHALMLLDSFMRLAAASGHHGLFFGAAGCPPLFDIHASNRNDEWRAQCLDTNAAVRAQLQAHPDIKTVIMVARWARYIEATETAPAPTSPPLLVDQQQSEPAAGHNHDVFERALRRSLADMRTAGRRVVLLESVPEVAVSVPDAMTQAAVLGRGTDFAPTATAYLQRQARASAMFKRVRADYPELEIVALADVLCDARQCRVTQDGKSLYYDDNHLSSRGVALIEAKLAAMLRGRQPTP